MFKLNSTKNYYRCTSIILQSRSTFDTSAVRNTFAQSTERDITRRIRSRGIITTIVLKSSSTCDTSIVRDVFVRSAVRDITSRIGSSGLDRGYSKTTVRSTIRVKSRHLNSRTDRTSSSLLMHSRSTLTHDPHSVQHHYLGRSAAYPILPHRKL